MKKILALASFSRAADFNMRPPRNGGRLTTNYVMSDIQVLTEIQTRIDNQEYEETFEKIATLDMWRATLRKGEKSKKSLLRETKAEALCEVARDMLDEEAKENEVTLPFYARFEFMCFLCGALLCFMATSKLIVFPTALLLLFIIFEKYCGRAAEAPSKYKQTHTIYYRY